MKAAGGWYPTTDHSTSPVASSVISCDVAVAGATSTAAAPAAWQNDRGILIGRPHRLAASGTIERGRPSYRRGQAKVNFRDLEWLSRRTVEPRRAARKDKKNKKL